MCLIWLLCLGGLEFVAVCFFESVCCVPAWRRSSQTTLGACIESSLVCLIWLLCLGGLEFVAVCFFESVCCVLEEIFTDYIGPVLNVVSVCFFEIASLVCLIWLLCFGGLEVVSVCFFELACLVCLLCLGRDLHNYIGCLLVGILMLLMLCLFACLTGMLSWRRSVLGPAHRPIDVGCVGSFVW